ncbi:MAG: UbiA family prenyltransferase [Candidatus Moranbacteria bacterium]|nr:UbiA family prenyltransferase [Candidatus Moranbacteria bacterium]
MIPFLRRVIRLIEQEPFSLPLFSVAFLTLILCRIGVESFLGFFAPQSLSFLFFEFAHTFLFFLTAFFLLIPVIRFAGAPSIPSAAHILLFGFLIILTPPVIDTVLFQGSNFWSFYKFDSLSGLLLRFFTFFGDRPDIGITYGVRVEVACVTLGVGLYALLASRKSIHAFKAALATYAVLFILGTFPSYLTFLIQGFSKGFFALGASDIAGLFLSPSELFSREAPDMRSALNVKMSLWYASILALLIPFFVYRHFRPLFFALFRNVRWPQIWYHGGLLFLGGLLAWHFTTPILIPNHFHILAIFLLNVSVGSAWLASVVVNDYFDTNIDIHTNQHRPLISGTIDQTTFITLGWLFFFASILFSALVSFSAALLLALYQTIAWIYSAPPFRLKRIPGIATLLASAAGIIILLIGFLLISPDNDFSRLPTSLLLFLFIAYAAALPLKDFKDIAGDKRDHVITFPVIFGEKKARLVFGSVLFALFILSVFVLHIRSAFPLAILFGGASFFLLQTTRKHHSWCTYARLPLIVLGLITGYGLCLLWFI